MSNSSLVSYTLISPFQGERTHAIDTVTVHCVVGQCCVEALGTEFQRAGKNASSNYGIGFDGKIGLYVPENRRSWCSSNSGNDNRAITIEVASDNFGELAVRDAAYKSLIDLLTDICKRNNIKRLVWSWNKNERVNHLNGCNMTVHRDYDAKSCPGEWLYSRHGEIARLVNERLEDSELTKDKVKQIALNEGRYAANEAIDKLMQVAGTGDKPSDFAAEAAAWAKENGLIAGFGSGDYAWQKPMTREEMVCLLHRYHNLLRE